MTAPDAAGRLTAREQEIVLLIGRGMDSRRIAQTLGIAYFTVRKHRSNILFKLGLNGPAQLSAYAAGLVAEVRSDPPSPWPGPP